MRHILLIVIFLSCTKDNRDDFVVFPADFHSYLDLPISQVHPSKKYDYWEYHFSGFGMDTIVFKSGNNQALNFDAPKIEKGFYLNCAPSCYFSYIIASTDHKIEIIDEDDEFKRFVGQVENIEEVLLLVKLNGYWYDPTDKRMGSYRKVKDGYDLLLLDYESCPMTEKSVRARMTVDGDFEVISIETIKKSDDCIIS